MEKIIKHEHDFLQLAHALGMDKLLIEGIQSTITKLRQGESLSYAEHRLVELLHDILDGGI